jgi:hypothetical protein
MRVYWGRDHIEQMQHDVIHNISFQWRPLQNSTIIDKKHLSPLSFCSSSSKKNCVCVVIPTKNVALTLYERWLSYPEVKNVIVLYNGPLRNIQLTNPNIKIIYCCWKGHGKTRNQAIPHLDTDFSFFTVDDALPISSTLHPLVEFLDSSSNQHVDAIVARQCPYPTADLYIQRRLLKYMPLFSTPVPFHQCDNVGTLYRTKILRQTPFPSVDIAEDFLWGLHKNIYYHPLACIVHSHTRSPLELFRRERGIYYVLREHMRINHPLEDMSYSMRQVYRYGIREGLNTFFEKLGSHIGFSLL